MFKIGDKVKIIKSDYRFWVPGMDSTIGKIGRIMNIREYWGETQYLIKFDKTVTDVEWEYNVYCIVSLREEKLKRILSKT